MPGSAACPGELPLPSYPDAHVGQRRVTGSS